MVILDSLEGQDLFSVLGVGFREDSYSELIANYFQTHLDKANEFLRQSFENDPPSLPVRVVETRLSLSLEDGKGAIPDLVFFCGDGELQEIYWIEAKIEASEGAGQTQKYEDAMREYARNKGIERVRGGFLTLGGTKPQSRNVKTLTYKPLAEILEPERFAVKYPWMQHAAAALKDRLAGYYSMKEEVEEETVDTKQSLQEFLDQKQGLVTSTDLFHWLTYRARVTDAFEFRTEAGVAHSAGSAHPLRTFYRQSWRSPLMEDGCSLAECRWIHLEVQIAPEAENLAYMLLHYETYPYKSRIASRVSDGRPDGQYDRADYEQYWERRYRFVKALADELQGTDLAKEWTRVNRRQEIPKEKNRNLVTKQNKRLDFTPDRSVDDFERWLTSGLESMAGVVDRALARTD
jgi:hypothetical protein